MFSTLLLLWLLPSVAPSPAIVVTRQSTPGWQCRLTVNTGSWTTCQQVLDFFSLYMSDFNTMNDGDLGSDCSGFVPGNEYCVRYVPLPASPVSTDATCGAQTDWASTCVGSAFGDCCSASGYCGNSSAHCGIGNCQGGRCAGLPQRYSTDGRCGPAFDDLQCGGSFGSCCSSGGWCGSSPDHCGAGCLSGACTSPTSSSAPPSGPTNAPGSQSPDGTCGYQKAYICNGSSYGSCCSAAGWCGSTEYHCSPYLDCQSSFGTCWSP